MSETEGRGFKRRTNHESGVTQTKRTGQRLKVDADARALVAAAHTGLSWTEQRGRIGAVTLQTLQRLEALLDDADTAGAVAGVVSALGDVYGLAPDSADGIRPLASAALCRLQKMAPTADIAETRHILGALVDAQKLAELASPPRPPSEMTAEEIEAELAARTQK